MISETDERLTPKQAADLIGMSLRWLYEKISKGVGPQVKRRGRRIFIMRSALTRWDAQDVIK